MQQFITVCALASSIVLAGGRSGAQTPADETTIASIRSKLLRLPYYGVFDFLAFTYSNGTVTLNGYAYALGLTPDAERAVKQAAPDAQVVNKIEVLPASTIDDALRWQTYYAIYSDPFLSHYAPGGGTLWGHPHRMVPGPSGSAARFPGMEPIGNWPIHIVVKTGRITLIGVVDNETDRTFADIKAKGVPGSFGVENEIVVEKQP
jgi:hyperosmotically inducible protein